MTKAIYICRSRIAPARKYRPNLSRTVRAQDRPTCASSRSSSGGTPSSRRAAAPPHSGRLLTASREALQSVGVSDAVKSKSVLGENVRQTLQYAETGNVDVAIVALSLSVQSKGRWVLIPQELHKPLDQALAVIKGTKREQQARQFAAFINSQQGRPTMRKYGFVLPGEAPAN